jgi:hypothetical protein
LQIADTLAVHGKTCGHRSGEKIEAALETQRHKGTEAQRHKENAAK